MPLAGASMRWSLRPLLPATNATRLASAIADCICGVLGPTHAMYSDLGSGGGSSGTEAFLAYMLAIVQTPDRYGPLSDARTAPRLAVGARRQVTQRKALP